MNGSLRLYVKPMLLMGSLLFSIGCSNAAGIRVIRVPAAGFSGAQTWNFLPSSLDPDREQRSEELELSTRVLERIRVELARRGLRYRAQDADLGIDARLEVRLEKRIVYERAAIETLPSFHSGVNYEIVATNRRVEINYRVGLMIRAVDRRRQSESWHAYYEGSNEVWSTPDVDGVVAATLASFPDASAGTFVVVDALEFSERESLVPKK